MSTSNMKYVIYIICQILIFATLIGYICVGIVMKKSIIKGVGGTCIVLFIFNNHIDNACVTIAVGVLFANVMLLIHYVTHYPEYFVIS
jgi:hypothetical protein